MVYQWIEQAYSDEPGEALLYRAEILDSADWDGKEVVLVGEIENEIVAACAIDTVARWEFVEDAGPMGLVHLELVFLVVDPQIRHGQAQVLAVELLRETSRTTSRNWRAKGSIPNVLLTCVTDRTELFVGGAMVKVWPYAQTGYVQGVEWLPPWGRHVGTLIGPQG